MKTSILAALALALLALGTGCSASVSRDATMPAAPVVASPDAGSVSSSRLDARLMPDEVEVVWTAPESSRPLIGAAAVPTTHPEAANKKGKLLLGSVHAFQ
jgi:hypothetical protein